jgi:hypothetical protein
VTADPATNQSATHRVWTIARIQNTLTSPVLIRRFLLDISHAPDHQVMNVFTAWQRVAATIEANASGATTTAGHGEPSTGHRSRHHPL